jgi:hypothetical protein
MAEKTTVGYLPGSDPEAVEANMAYQEALQRMQNALEARRSRFIDPTALALAQGFLAPTQTGGFGESLGLAAKNLREAQLQEEKEERDIAQAQLGLAGKGLELERMRQREREFGRLLGEPQGGLPTTTTTGGALPSGRPMGGALPGQAPKGFETVEGIPVAPPNPNFMTARQYLQMARMDPSVSPISAMKDASKLEQDRYQVRESGVQDLASGMFYPFPKGDLVTRQIYGYPGEYKVDSRTAALLDLYASNGDPRYYEIASRVVEGPKPPARASEPAKPAEAPVPGAAPATTPGAAPAAPGAAPGQPPSNRLLSVQDVEAMSAEARETAALEAKRKIGEKSEYIDAGKSVTSRLAPVNMLYPIASSENAKQIFGVFERPDVMSAFLKLTEGGIGTRSFQISLSNLREALTNAGIPQTLINQAQMAYSLMAQVQLETARLGQGQGSVSNFERDLFAQASIARSDNPAVILAKLDMIKARAELDRQRAQLVRQHKGSIDDLVGSDQWNNLTNTYHNQISQIFTDRLASAPISQTNRMPAPPGRDNQGAANRLPSSVR